MPRDFRIPVRDVLWAADMHWRKGWSLRAIGRLHWQRWEYASAQSATVALSAALRTLERPVRDRVDATVLASTMHGRSRRAARKLGHPDHEAFLAHRRAVRAKEREA